MVTSELKTSADSQVSTRHTTSGLPAAQSAVSSSILGGRLLQLKYSIEDDLLLAEVEWTL